jgi:hypothetical protein
MVESNRENNNQIEYVYNTKNRSKYIVSIIFYKNQFMICSNMAPYITSQGQNTLLINKRSLFEGIFSDLI